MNSHYDNQGIDVGEFIEVVIEDVGSYTIHLNSCRFVQ